MIQEKEKMEMGFLKTGLKIVGSAALGATGVASTILRGMANAVGSDELANAIGSIQDKSFEKIGDMWTPEEERTEEYYVAQEEKRRQRAENTARSGEMRRKEFERIKERAERERNK